MKHRLTALLIALMMAVLCAVPALADGSIETINYSNGDVYVGEVVDGLPNGHGTYTTVTDNVYHGSFVDGHFHGHGVYVWTDGSYYAGSFVKDMFEGKGLYAWASGETYTGDFVDDVRTGKGTYIWTDGACYVGDFVEGKLCGHGIYTFDDGSYYIGEFQNDNFHGQGIRYAADGTVTSAGLFENGNLVTPASDGGAQQPPAEDEAAPFTLVDYYGYRIAIPTGYVSESTSDEYNYYYYSDDGDFIMLMPFNIAAFEDWMLSETFLPVVYELCYESVVEAAGDTTGGSYKDITVNGDPAGYGQCSFNGINLDYIFYYSQGLENMMVICYTDVTGVHTGSELLQIVIDNTTPAN